MNDAFRMGCIHRFGNFDGDPQQRIEFHRSVADQVLQRGAFEELHRDEGLALMLSDFVDGADVGMVQSGVSARFTPETLQGRLVVRDLVWQEFQGDETTQLRVLGLEDYSHATTAELFQNAVVRDCPVDHSRAKSYVGYPHKSMELPW